MNFAFTRLSDSCEHLKELLLQRNPELAQQIVSAKDIIIFKNWLQMQAVQKLSENPIAMDYYHRKSNELNLLRWCDYAAIRILDYLADNSSENPFFLLWNVVKYQTNVSNAISQASPLQVAPSQTDHTQAAPSQSNHTQVASSQTDHPQDSGQVTPDFMYDMLELWDQFYDRRNDTKPRREQVLVWMERYPNGWDDEIILQRSQNKERILNLLLPQIEKRPQEQPFSFPQNASLEQKHALLRQWWDDPQFHLMFPIRDPDTLNFMLGGILDKAIMQTLHIAQEKKIPFFINPYYLSLLLTQPTQYHIDQVIRDYMLYSAEFVENFGRIVAWEKEDQIQDGQPNVAGWLLPQGNNIHRRYPDVAVLIPDGLGRTCAGLCSTCQRMYEFQRGSMQFYPKTLEPSQWAKKLRACMDYFENDPQLCDILITGGDAFMLTDAQLEDLLAEVLAMAQRKVQANLARPEGKKYAGIVRIRLGTRLLVYLPQRITKTLCEILAKFRIQALQVGIKQFIIQTHFSSALEITPESRRAIFLLLQAGWLITNQTVFITSASRRGSTAKLRQALNEIGVLPYYTFTVKGYQENYYNFVPNARAYQEQVEEKIWGNISDNLAFLHDDPIQTIPVLAKLRRQKDIPFVATDRHVLNLPGVGKSLNFRVVSILKDGRRVLEFDYDHTRLHSPKIVQIGRIRVEESKSITQYLRHIQSLGEDIQEYSTLYGYSLGQTALRLSVFDYPKFALYQLPNLVNYRST